MKLKNLLLAMGLGLCLVTAAQQAAADPFVVSRGDNDGYGFGVADNGPAVWPGPGPSGTDYDGRSAAEAAATNGTQITDIYSALFPAFGPSFSQFASVFFPFSGTLNSATLGIDMGDFQSTAGGAIAANINGVALPFAFDDGFQNTKVRFFALNAAMINAANLAGQVVLNLDHTGSGDFIAFDLFRLQGDVTPIPEPEIYAMLAAGLGLMGFVARRRKQQLAAA